MVVPTAGRVFAATVGTSIARPLFRWCFADTPRWGKHGGRFVNRPSGGWATRSGNRALPLRGDGDAEWASPDCTSPFSFSL